MIGRAVESEALAEIEDPRLGGGVGRVRAAPAPQRRQGRHMHQFAVVLFLHHGEHGLRHKEHGLEVNVHHSVPALQRDRLDGRGAYESANSRIPIATICDKSSRVSGDIVELNNFEAGVLAANHLLSLGHTNIAVLTHTSDKSTAFRATRVAGILSEVRQVVSEDHLLVLTGNNSKAGILEEKCFHYHVGYSLAQNKKLYQNGITGLICVNDLMTYGVMDALIGRGYRIPEDFSVIGSDNLLFSSMFRVSLTTIEHHPDIVAQSALTTLLNRTHMSSTNQSASSTARFHVQCQPNLIVRGSTGPVRTGAFPPKHTENNGAL